MRRLSSKSKKGKGANANAANDNNKSAQQAENQDNENQTPSDTEESSSDKRVSLNQSKKGGRKSVKKNAAVKTEDSDIEDEGLGDEENSNKKGKRGRKSVVKTEDSDDEGSDDVPLNSKTKKGKKGLKNENDENSNADDSQDAEYEVEKVVDCRMRSGVKQYKIRWKGFSEDQDTWELETNLDCPDLIKSFLAANPDAFKKPVKEKPMVGAKRKKITQPVKSKKQRNVEPVAEEGGEKIYEVEKVVEVHFKKNGDREFLIRWKGFGSEDDTWEPEANLNCSELIEKFMQKVEKVKQLTVRELRANPQVTNRFTLQTHESGRRLSSRHTSRQRTTYFNSE